MTVLSFIYFFHITDSEERTEAFLNTILCNNSIREMPCVQTTETKVKDILDFSLDIFHLHFASQNNECVLTATGLTDVIPHNLCWCIVEG